MALGINSGRGVWVGIGVEVALGVSVAVGRSVAVGAFAVLVSFTLAMAVSCASVCDAGTSIVGLVGGLDAHADNKTNKTIARGVFVFMISPICIVDRDKAG